MFIEPDVERKFFRVNFDRYVDIDFVSNKYSCCRIKDLSLNGMFIKGDFGGDEGKFCNIDFVQTGNTTELRLQALAKVVRKEEEGIAVEFSSMTYDSYMYLQASLLCETLDAQSFGKMLNENCPFEITD